MARQEDNDQHPKSEPLVDHAVDSRHQSTSNPAPANVHSLALIGRLMSKCHRLGVVEKSSQFPFHPFNEFASVTVPKPESITALRLNTAANFHHNFEELSNMSHHPSQKWKKWTQNKK